MQKSKHASNPIINPDTQKSIFQRIAEKLKKKPIISAKEIIERNINYNKNGGTQK